MAVDVKVFPALLDLCAVENDDVPAEVKSRLREEGRRDETRRWIKYDINNNRAYGGARVSDLSAALVQIIHLHADPTGVAAITAVPKPPPPELRPSYIVPGDRPAALQSHRLKLMKTNFVLG